MNSFIESLNQWGGRFSDFAWPMLWQSSLLILVVSAVDFLVRRKVRASVRYALWLVILVKLCLPPTLALPTGAAWWLFPKHAAAHPVTIPHYVVTYDTTAPIDPVLPTLPMSVPPPKLDGAGWTLFGGGFVSVVLLLWLACRWWQISRKISRATTAEGFTGLLEGIRIRAGLRSPLQLKLIDGRMSPAVCGLLRPVILLPRVLAEQLSVEQLRAVLLHEAFHLRRRDVWVNCAQALLQIIYWWHPLLWLANARIRRLREEAVDDAVMLSLREEGDSYAPTLLAVAKLAFNRPLMSLGLVGIMESRSALGQRIERLVDFSAPRKAGLTFLSLCGVFVFGAVALPMGEAPASAVSTNDQSQVARNVSMTGNSTRFVERVRVTIHGDDNAGGRDSRAVTLRNRTFKVNHPISAGELKKALVAAGVTTPPTAYFYTDSGMIVVHGSEAQLARVNGVVKKLNGFSTNKVAEEPATYIKDSAEATASTESDTNLFNRTFKVDKYAFANAVRSIQGLDTNDVAVIAKSLFASIGVDWETPKGKTIFYNDGLGLLFVRATLSDLDTVENAVQALIYVAPQIHIKARFIELPGSAVGDVYLGSINVNAATMPLVNQTEGLTLQRMRPDSLVGIMTDSQFQTALGAIYHNPGFDELAEPEGTTTSGRRMQLRSTQVFTVITNFSYQEISNVTAIVPQTNAVDTGPILDTVAFVRADGYRIDLKTTASLTKFLGYDQPTNTAVAYTSKGEKINLPTILPSFAIREASADITMCDGQTVILGGIKPRFYDGGKEVSTEPDYFVRAKAARGQPNEKDKELLIFITVTLVDPAGNRIHSDDEVPFAKNSIPRQSDP